MQREFTITKEHLLLAKSFYVDWDNCEYGAPSIDPKRPYGNSDVEEDICRILGKKKVEVDYDKRYLTKDMEYAGKIHKEMEIALQIILCTQSFKEGDYYKEDEYGSKSWKLIQHEN